jgi:hypothetical protein
MPNKARIMLILAAAVFVASIAAAALTFTGNARTAPAESTLGILQSRATSADKLPATVLNSPVASHLPDLTAARHAFNSGGDDIYVAPGTNGTICLMVAGQASFGSCASDAVLDTGVIYIVSPQADGTMNAYLVVPDGYSEATIGSMTVGVIRNVAAFRGAPSSSLATLSGSAGTRNVDLGAQTPTSTVTTS